MSKTHGTPYREVLFRKEFGKRPIRSDEIRQFPVSQKSGSRKLPDKEHYRQRFGDSTRGITSLNVGPCVQMDWNHLRLYLMRLIWFTISSTYIRSFRPALFAGK
jgi:hypothetical protein